MQVSLYMAADVRNCVFSTCVLLFLTFAEVLYVGHFDRGRDPGYLLGAEICSSVRR